VQSFTDSDKPAGVARGRIRVTPTGACLDFGGPLGDD
jgi:hypothetical protein